MFAPASLDLKGLFCDRTMFESSSRWRKRGFAVEGEGDESDIMTASHPSAPGYLFKKYSDDKVSPKDQLENYRRRIKGAKKLRAYVADQRLTRIVVPGKSLHELPSEFDRKGKTSYVLIVEKMTLLDAAASKQMYRGLDNEGLRQLCVVLIEFRGLDSGVRNIPFTDQGQMAFIDTERWDDDREVPLKRIRAYLSDEQWAFAKKIFEKA